MDRELGNGILCFWWSTSIQATRYQVASTSGRHNRWPLTDPGTNAPYMVTWFLPVDPRFATCWLSVQFYRWSQHVPSSCPPLPPQLFVAVIRSSSSPRNSSSAQLISASPLLQLGNGLPWLLVVNRSSLLISGLRGSFPQQGHKFLVFHFQKGSDSRSKRLFFTLSG